jgi:hypothetical protein
MESKQFRIELTDASGNAITGPKNSTTITIDIATGTIFSFYMILIVSSFY